MSHKRKNESKVLGTKTEFKEKEKDKNQDKDKISSLMSKITQNSKNSLIYSLIEYMSSKNYACVEYKSIIEHFKNKLIIYPNSLINPNTYKTFTSEESLIDSINKQIKNNPIFIITKSFGKNYVQLNIKMTLKFIKKIYREYIEKNNENNSPPKDIFMKNINDFNHVDNYDNINDKINNYYNINNYDNLNLLNNNFSINITKDGNICNNYNEIEADKEKGLSQNNNNSLNTSNVILNNNLNQSNIYLSRKVFSLEEENKYFISLYGELRLCLEKINNYYSELDRIKTLIESIIENCLYMKQKREEYINLTKYKNDLEKHQAHLYDLAYNQIKDIQLLQKTYSENSELVDSHLFLTKENISSFDENNEKIRKSISSLNNIENDINAKRWKINQGLNDLIGIYKSTPFEDIIGKKLIKIIISNNKNNFNTIHRITFSENILLLENKFDLIKSDIKEFEKTIK